MALEGARVATTSGDARPFTAGNITWLRVDGHDVVAAYDFEEDEEGAERMPLDAFLELLMRWREQVVEAQRTATEALPETYRRNPHR